MRQRAKIVAATWRLIVEPTLEGTTACEIAATLRVAVGALARYFPGKDEIGETAFESMSSTPQASARTSSLTS